MSPRCTEGCLALYVGGHRMVEAAKAHIGKVVRCVSRLQAKTERSSETYWTTDPGLPSGNGRFFRVNDRHLLPIGDDDAVQERSSEKVDARQRAEDGEEVGERDAERQAAPQEAVQGEAQWVRSTW